MTITELLVWGIIVHFICDWLLQNEWMAVNKTSLCHPAAYVHAGIHTVGLLLVFGPLVALALGISHLLIDTRRPVIWWSMLIRQTQPRPITKNMSEGVWEPSNNIVLMDLGSDVRTWVDQVFHITAIAIAALIVGAVS